MSIRNKILLILFLGSLSILSLIAFSYSIYVRQTMQHEVAKNLEAMANVQQQCLERFVDYNKEKLRLISSRTQLRISLVHYLKEGDAASLGMVKRIISDAIEDSEDIEEIVVMDPGGKVVSSVTGRFTGSGIADSLCLSAGRVRECASIVDSGAKPQLFFAGPLHFEGRLIGVVAMQIRITRLQKLLKDYTGLGSTGEVLIGMEAEGGEILIFSPLRFKEAPLRIAGGSVDAIPMQNALEGRERFYEDALDYRHEPVVAASRYLEELGLGIVVKIDRAELLAPQYDLQLLMLESVLGMVAVVLIASYILSRVITRRVIDITGVAMRISGGELKQRADTATEDELGTLARALNQMADRLIDANLQLERKVREKTADLRVANERLAKLAQLDGLTGIANRRQFDREIAKEWRRSMRREEPLSLILVDLDHFKEVNDHLGHLTGDEYLKRVALLLSGAVNRPGDLAARYGGEEFAVILQGSSASAAEAMAERMRAAVEACGLEHPASDASSSLTISAGVATRIPGKNEAASLLIDDADGALYEAKRRGRNRVVAAAAGSVTGS